MAATVRRQAGRDLPPAADIARPRAAIVRHGAIPGPAAVLAAAAGAAASVEAASAADTGNTVEKRRSGMPPRLLCQFLRSLRNGNTLSLTVVRPTAIIRPPLKNIAFSARRVLLMTLRHVVGYRIENLIWEESICWTFNI